MSTCYPGLFARTKKVENQGNNMLATEAPYKIVFLSNGKRGRGNRGRENYAYILASDFQAALK
eukprot:scaffold255518_cov18-Tisochrysis_lutea.AAC.2